MARIRQTLARIGSGAAAIAALCWLLWPSDLKEVLSNPEAIFAFSTLLVVWVFTEFKFSEEVQLRVSSPNDIRVARDFIRLHSNEFRYLLKDTDLFQFVDANLYSQVNNLRRRHETGKLEFQHKELNEKLSAFVADLEVLGLFVAQHTVPELIGGVLRTGFKPCETVTQEEYDQLITLSLEANDLASKAWERLDALVAMIKKSVPEALDIEI